MFQTTSKIVEIGNLARGLSTIDGETAAPLVTICRSRDRNNSLRNVRRQKWLPGEEQVACGEPSKSFVACASSNLKVRTGICRGLAEFGSRN